MITKSVLFVVVTYNAMKWIDRCLSSTTNISGSKYLNKIDTIVIDNGSKDGTQDYIKANFPTVIFHQSDKNLGFGQANNVGLQFALKKDYDYVYLLNQDAWVFNDTLDRLIEVNIKHPEYGILSPFQMQANGKRLDENFIKNTCSYNSNKQILNDFFFNSKEFVYTVHSVMAAHWLISNSCLHKVGGFSPTFPQYGEDGNYADRVHFFGYKVGIIPAARAVHDRENRQMTFDKQVFIYYMNMLRRYSYIYRHDRYSLLGIFFRLMGIAIKSRSIYPLRLIVDLCKRRKDIIHNRKISIRECAFLNINN